MISSKCKHLILFVRVLYGFTSFDFKKVRDMRLRSQIVKLISHCEVVIET